MDEKAGEICLDVRFTRLKWYLSQDKKFEPFCGGDCVTDCGEPLVDCNTMIVGERCEKCAFWKRYCSLRFGAEYEQRSMNPKKLHDDW
jgi:hypothetical protein